MLDWLYITKSKIRRGILSLFFTNPERSYYLRELERILGFSAGSIRRELLKFTRDGIFLTERVGNLVYYRVNENHPLYEEIRSIVSKTIGVEGSLREVISRVDGIETSFIFGSFATGKEGPESDVDLFIVGDPDVTRLNEVISDLEGKLKREVNVVVYSRDEFEEEKKRGSGFIREVLESPKIMLIGNEDEL